MNTATTTETPAALVNPGKPEFFPLPQRGQDPHFGLGRSSYYDLERRGLLRLVRIRKPGNLRGRVLVPYVAVSKLILQFSQDGANA